MKGSEIKYGIDLGGTKIEGAALLMTGKNMKVLVRHRVPTEQSKGYRHILNQIAACVEELESQTGQKVKKVGIGTPGSIDPDTGRLKNSNTQCLQGQRLLADLQSHLNREVKIANDANCFALAEALYGRVPEVVPDAVTVFGVILGTGVGGGVVMDGKVLIGRHGIGGEWGHNHLLPDGEDCYCGSHGCVETVISGPALERYYKRQTGHEMNLRDIYASSLEGDNAAQHTIDRLCHFFGKGISQIINVLDPDAIVIGGGVGNIDALYDRGKAEILPFLFNPVLTTPILKPKLGDSAGVIGAALLF